MTLLADKGLSLDELEADLDRDYNKCVAKMEAKGKTMEEIKQAAVNYQSDAYVPKPAEKTASEE